MKFRLLKIASLFVILLASRPIAAGQFYYDWVPDTGSGGFGYILFDDTNIIDRENFYVLFNPTNVLEISFIFDMGFEIESAFNFTGTNTLQSDLFGMDVFASGGVIDGPFTWNMNYENAIGETQSSFTGTSLELITCVINPCPPLEVDINFKGNFASENNSGTWQIRNVVPVPPAVYLFGTSLLALIGFTRRKSSIDCKKTTK